MGDAGSVEHGRALPEALLAVRLASEITIAGRVRWFKREVVRRSNSGCTPQQPGTCTRSRACLPRHERVARIEFGKIEFLEIVLVFAQRVKQQS